MSDRHAIIALTSSRRAWPYVAHPIVFSRLIGPLFGSLTCHQGGPERSALEFATAIFVWQVTRLADSANDEDAAMGEEIWSTLVSEFSDVPDASTITLISVRLAIAAVLGGILGYERERKGRSAGVRTHMLVAVGAALFVIGPLQSGMEIGDLSRVLQGIVQGIGFLGAGAIMVRSAQRQVEGLTTAANIWATAGIGVIAGLGLEATAVLSTAIVLIILAAVPLILPKQSAPDQSVEEPLSPTLQNNPETEGSERPANSHV